MGIEVSTQEIVTLRLGESESFHHTAPNGTANIDTVVAVRWHGKEWTYSGSGYVIKKDGAVGNARRQYIFDLDELPALLRGELAQHTGR